MSDPIVQLIFLLIKAILMPVLIVTMVAFVIYFERKFAGSSRDAWGRPTWALGLVPVLWGYLKLLSKEDLIPAKADKPVFRLAPYIISCPPSW